MGGNVTAKTSCGELTKASKIPLTEIGLDVFREKFKSLFKELNALMHQKHDRFIWEDESIIDSGYVFNGSTSFLMDPNHNEEILKVKPNCGDVDITVPVEIKVEVFHLLKDLQNKEIVPGLIYKGSNKSKTKSIGNQVNAVFALSTNNKTYNCQVDFEFLDYENNKPTEWSKFSHSSELIDTKENIKAVHHKYLLRSLIGSSSLRNDIIICSQTSNPGNYKISTSKIHANPRMFKFSVGKGLRIAYEQLFDFDNKPIIVDGKLLFRDIDTKKSTYITGTKVICKFAFLQESVSEKDTENFKSFIGCLSLMRKYLSREIIELTHDRYIELLWGNPRGRAQELEVQNPDLDLKVKINGYKKFINVLQLPDKSEDLIKEYYLNYGQRGSSGKIK